MTGTTFIQKSRAWFRWMFLDPRLVWALIVALGLAVFVLWFCSELIFRSSGFGLQIIGVFFAAREIFSNERLFGQPRIKDRIDGWGRRRPGKTQSIGLASLSCQIAFGSAHGTVRMPKVDTDSLEEQVTKLWKNIDLISQEVSGLTGQVDQNKQGIEEALKSEREAREHADKSLRELVKEATVGEPLVAYFGLILVLMGSVITTYSEFLHKLVHSF